MEQNFNQAVYRIVGQIPAGFVMNYGGIGALMGYMWGGRRVARALSNAPEGVPCHRVVNAAGRLAPIELFPNQRPLLEGEGVAFLSNGCVDMKKHLYSPFEDQSTKK